MTNKEDVLVHLQEWLEDNKDRFHPPVSLSTMFNSQLTMIFLSGPNSRKDFHIEEGEEIFYMVNGEMNLKVIDKDQYHNIIIKAGEIFVLPSRVRHSPRRPINSLGFVIERKRLQSEEYDGLLFYNEDVPGDVLAPIHEIYGYVGDNFEKDIKHMVTSANNDISMENVTSKLPTPVNPLILPNHNAKLHVPVSIKELINEKKLSQGGNFQIFPDLEESKIELLGPGEYPCSNNSSDIILWVIEGSAHLKKESTTEINILPLQKDDFYLKCADCRSKDTIIVTMHSVILKMQMIKSKTNL